MATGICGGITLEKGDFAASRTREGAFCRDFPPLEGGFRPQEASRASRRGRCPASRMRAIPCPAPFRLVRSQRSCQDQAGMAATIATSASGRMRRIVSRSRTITATRITQVPALADCVHPHDTAETPENRSRKPPDRLCPRLQPTNRAPIRSLTMTASRWPTERASRSSRTTTRVSQAGISRSRRANTGRLRSAPEACDFSLRRSRDYHMWVGFGGPKGPCPVFVCPDLNAARTRCRVSGNPGLQAGDFGAALGGARSHTPADGRLTNSRPACCDLQHDGTPPSVKRGDG